MSAPGSVTAFPAPSSRLRRFQRQHGWFVSVAVLLVLLVALRASQVPAFGGFELRALFGGALAIVLLSMAQAVVVISGGLNMAAGSLLVFANSFSALLMKDGDLAGNALIALLTIGVCVVISALLGYLTNVTGVPDIIVTLALSFVIGGAALVLMPSPGGGVAPAFQTVMVGSFSNPLPAVVWILITLVVWLPFKRSRSGVAIYAMGSDSGAAYLAGVNLGRTRTVAYAVSGAIVGLGGVVATAFTGSADSQITTGLSLLLSSVGAAVLGGVALSGGKGGLMGPAIGALIIGLIPAVMLGFGWDPSLAQVAQGVIVIAVVMIGAFAQTRGKSA